MVTEILKRDGRTSRYEKKKITDAIYKAAEAAGGQDYATAKELSDKVDNILNEKYIDIVPTVEQIQDTVEKTLIESGHAKTAKNYILYRAERNKVREMNTKLMKIYEDLTFKSSIENDVKRENANINGDTAMGTMLKYGSEGAKNFYEMFILDEKHAAAHAKGDIHIHDLDFYTLTTTCCQIDLQKLFKGGFSTGNGFIREPKDIRTYSALACIAIQSNQNDQHGGQSIPKFDYDLAQGVKKTYRKAYITNMAKALELLAGIENSEEVSKNIYKNIEEKSGLYPTLDDNEEFLKLEREDLDKLDHDDVNTLISFTKKSSLKETDKATYQAMEALIHNLNTMHSRAGAQVPFSSINYGTDTSSEGRMIIRNVLLATKSGLGNGETPIFPVQIFKVKEGVNYNPEDPNYDLFKLAMEVSSERLFPNFSFIDSPFNLKYYKEGDPDSEIAYMGCRTRVMANVDKDNEIVTGRGNLSFTSINLPRLAIEAKGDIDKFYSMLDDEMNLCVKQLLHRFKIQCAKTVRNSPFLMGEGVWINSENLKPDDTVEEVLKHGTLSIGFIGLAETLTALVGKHHGQSEESEKLGLEIISHMRDKVDEETEKRGLNFSLVATPAEGLSGRFVRMDKKRYGIIEGVTDKDYYTNSFHVPVGYDISAFEKIKKEAPFHELTNGGHITYVELDGDTTKNLEAFEKIVRCMKDMGLGYGAINHPVDRDPVCGYNGVIYDECPHCHRKEDDIDVPFERIRRITGYLVGTLDRFNNGKRAEESDRVKHSLNSEMESL
ncbi:anaerobic ribonucleoside triphosphate reductase [Anaerofustis stercorihominis]|uniref:Anaerobic ribonucleoside triphosphate reductase n=1 Tax=Anaerofustis stercorihominis TaxID=214853 RepID=A0A3E3E100_9FIRM|nr:anaerobic ribonucleoside triphosphate reductase [Anaerofustis stercorihominis]RGD75016.1 anaerobic ribonucleoside triphosphate reductase [Anaerofustis stercorihominis]